MSFFQQQAPSASSSLSLGGSNNDVVVAPLSPERPATFGSHHRQTSMTSSQHSSGGLHSQQQERVYFDDSDIPITPFLQVNLNDEATQYSVPSSTRRHDSTSETNGNASKEEADAAAGMQSPNVLQRVSSFNLLSRVTSHPKLLSLSSTPEGAGINEREKESNGDAQGKDGGTVSDPSSSVQPSWRLRDRMKTAGVGLIMALNVGTDPPDIIKPHPCAKLQCWMDPSSVTRAKAKEKIGERLEAQYAKWQQQRSARPLKYRRALDPTVEDVRALCLWLRRQARQERILLHYNGHGVPRPTSNGEIWVFDKNHTEYIPLSVSDLRQWAGSPTICILDCSSAGVLIPFLTAPPVDTTPNTPVNLSPSHGSAGSVPISHQRPVRSPTITDMDTAANLWVKDMMVLCPTSDQEFLPLDPDYPADIFTSCLTTPIQIALRWFVRNNRASMGDLDPDVVDDVPGHANDRKTPLGELNWIFTAITDSIAWNVLPKPLFQRLFRQDLLVASMFRNFLLADRILRSMNCTPQSYPPLPPGVADHPLWYAWDLACETCLFGLLKDGTLSASKITKVGTNAPNHETGRHHHDTSSPNRHESNKHTEATQNQSLSSPFFTEQLTAFEVWLDYASFSKGNTDHLEPPEQLPVLLQVLLSQIHRVRALELLRRFLELGPWAVNLSLSLGIFPYVMKLLQSPEYKTVLLHIWASILKFDPSCQVDLVKDNALGHFIQPLANWASASNQHPQSPLAEASKQRILASFSLAATFFKYPAAQKEGLRQNLHIACNNLLVAQIKLQEKQREQAQLEAINRRASSDASRFELLSPLAREWLCFCLGNMVKAYPPSQAEVYNANAHLSLMTLQRDDEDPTVRAAASYAIGCLFEFLPPSLTSSSSSSSLSGEGGSSGQVPAPNSSTFSSPSPISLGPQAFASIPPSQQIGVDKESSARTERAQTFLQQQAPIASMNVPSTVSTAFDSRPGVGNIQPSTQQFAGAGAQHQAWSGGNHHQNQGVMGSTMVGAQNLQTGMMQQSGALAVGPQIAHHPVTNVQSHTGQQGAPSIGHSNQFGHGTQPLHSSTSEGQIQSGQMLQAQQGGIMFSQRYPTHTDAGAMGVMASGPVSMISSPGQSYSIGMPIIGSPLGSTPIMAGRPMVGSGSPGIHPNQQSHSRRRPTVFEDRRRVEFDMKVMESSLKALPDGSPLVRYEITMALSSFVEKYLQAFLVVAEDGSRIADAEDGEVNGSDGLKSMDDQARVVALPRGVNQLIMERFGRCWKAIRKIQHHDPHPKVSGASSTMVRVVHETLLDIRMEKEHSVSRKGKPSALFEIQEEGEDGMERAASETHLSALLSPDSKVGMYTPLAQIDGTATRLPSVKLHPLRRSASETTGVNFPDGSPVPSIPLQSPISRVMTEKLLPKSSYYSWKRSIFSPDSDADEPRSSDLSDPLNPLGAAQSYRRRRNAHVREGGRRLADRFVDLMPRTKVVKKGLDALLDEDEEEDDDRYESLKNELRMKEAKLLRNDFEAKMTSMLKFHSFESALVSCDNEDGITVWDYEKGKVNSRFRNRNPDGSRMTSAFWINETSSSLFFVGCDDGSARVWKGILEVNGQVSNKMPSLSSAFFAIPDMEPGARGKSGLICEWQQKTGTLIAGKLCY